MRSLQYLLALVVLLAGVAAERRARDISHYANQDGYIYPPVQHHTGYFYDKPKVPFPLPSDPIRNVYPTYLPPSYTTSPPQYLPPASSGYPNVIGI